MNYKEPKTIPVGWYRVAEGAKEKKTDRFWGWHTRRWKESAGLVLTVSHHSSNFIIRKRRVVK